MRSLPSNRSLLVFCVLLPAAVASSNQVLFELADYFRGQNLWLYPWMVFSTAVLSWCTGRYLSPAWLRWLVFGWCLALLVILTFASCMGGRVERELGYVLVSALVSLIILWAILVDFSWQWRLPTVLATGAVAIFFSGSFDTGWRSTDWNLLMVLTAVVVTVLCAVLRFRGFSLLRINQAMASANDEAASGAHQFGLKHILLWATALAPILLVARGLDFFVFKRLGAPDLVPFGVVALSIATVNLIAIWTVLGEGHIFIRLAALLVIPFSLAIGLRHYLQYIESTYRIVRIGPGGQTYQDWTRTWFDSLVSRISESSNSWTSWLWLDAALLAALLLFLRASGYRLVRGTSTPA